jgi:hypothetical protein
MIGRRHHALWICGLQCGRNAIAERSAERDVPLDDPPCPMRRTKCDRPNATDCATSYATRAMRAGQRDGINTTNSPLPHAARKCPKPAAPKSLPPVLRGDPAKANATQQLRPTQPPMSLSHNKWGWGCSRKRAGQWTASAVETFLDSASVEPSCDGLCWGATLSALPILLGANGLGGLVCQRMCRKTAGQCW